MKIQFVVPPVNRTNFTGGIWCVMQYAHGMAARGHEVVVVPITPGPQPEWFGQKQTGLSVKRKSVASRLFELSVQALGSTVKAGYSRGDHAAVKDAVAAVLDFLMSCLLRVSPYEYYRGTSFRYLQETLETDADVTVCTHFETVLPTLLYLEGRVAYFAQHYEPYFWKESRGGRLSQKEAEATYSAGVPVIANSTWLANEIKMNHQDAQVAVCLNAIEQDLFAEHDAGLEGDPEEFRIVSFGGRGLDWKGFDEMAQAIALVRQARPALNIVWSVFGGASLPPSNLLAPYHDLGFVPKNRLSEVYHSADLLLSASWYESFPLFPIEAMACGLPTITTQLGTEDFARHRDTAEIVPPRDVNGIARGILHLLDDEGYRQKLGRSGAAEAKKYTWARSVDTFEALMVEAIS